MKNYLLPLFALPCFFNAQTGNVGINTPTPTKTLDVNGDFLTRKLSNGLYHTIKTNVSGLGSYMAVSDGTEISNSTKFNILSLSDNLGYMTSQDANYNIATVQVNGKFGILSTQDGTTNQNSAFTVSAENKGYTSMKLSDGTKSSSVSLDGSSSGLVDFYYFDGLGGYALYTFPKTNPLDGQILVNEQDAVTGKNNLVWKNNTAGGGTGPWQISGTTNPATSNTQNIYQTGKVGIGSDPTATPEANLNIFENNTSEDTGASYGIHNSLSTTKKGSKNGILNELKDNATDGGGTVYGISNVTTTKNPSATAIKGISNTLNIDNGSAPNVTPSGIDSRVVDSRQGVTATNPLRGNLFQTTIDGSRAGNSGTGAGTYVLTELKPVSAYGGSQYFGQYNQIIFSPPSGGDVNMGLATAASANFNYVLPAGNFTSTGVHGSASGFDRLHIEPTASGTATISTSFGHRSWTEHISTGNITVNNIKTIESRTALIKGSGSLNVTGNVYGLDIYKDPFSAGSANIAGNIYGIHIDPFIYNDHASEKTYNIYSEGANTKNVFEGRVGIGQIAPSAQLHIVKQATDLTPAIIEGCGVYADNTEASAAGLPIGALYRTISGVLMVRY